jgi:hypothetical protein
MKNMISTHTKDFSHENVDPISGIFERIFFQIANFYDKFNRQPRMLKDYSFFLLSYPVCSQIYLSHLWMITISTTSQN